MKKLIYISIVLVALGAQAQDKQVQKEQQEAEAYVVEGNDLAQADAFVDAEAVYRKAIAFDPENVPAKYNMGSLYYKNDKFEESTQRLIQAAEVAQTKEEKHEAFHNLGNAFFKQKDFKQAVEAYKNALRNNPNDEETRYNLALAKQEEEQDGGGGDDENENQDQDQDQQDDQDGEGDEQESDDGQEKETDDEGEEKEDPDQQGDEENEEGKPDDQKDSEGGKDEEKQQPPPPQPGQLSPQQVKNLLEAINNQEEQTQEKVNAQKVKGAQIKTEKDW